VILNAYAVLDAFVTASRGLVALAVVVLSVFALCRSAGRTSAETRRALEDRGYMLFLLSFLLLVLNVTSWPLLYLLLQSYVPEWPGVMCIFGVTQIGAGSHGTARFLPALLEFLQWSKPLLVFLTGGWFVLYAMNRRTQTAPLTKRVLVALITLGVVAAADAAVEASYLVIPKNEEFLATGCCTNALGRSLLEASQLPEALLEEESKWGLPVCYFVVNLGMILALFCSSRSSRVGGLSVLLPSMLLGSSVTLFVSKSFLREVAAPRLLHLPNHHCIYDVLIQFPVSVVGISLFYLASFAVGWSCLVAWFANCSETKTVLRDMIRELLLLGMFGYLGSVVLMSIALAIA
jgi:hypothetical protein